MPSLLDDPEAYAFAAQIAEDRRRKLTNQQALNAILQGVGDLPYTLLGAPVEISTGLLRAGGMAQGEQAGGIDYFKRKATELGIRPPDSDNPTMRDMRMASEIAMGGVDPTRVARAGGAVAGAVAREAKPIIGDALENYMAKSGLAPRVAPEGGLLNAKPTAPVSPAGFYSATEQAALNLQRNKGQGQAFINDLMKAPDVKKDELEYMGLLGDFAKKPQTTKQELIDYIQANRTIMGEKRLGDQPTRWEGNTLFVDNEPVGSIRDTSAGFAWRTPDGKYEVLGGRMFDAVEKVEQRLGISVPEQATPKYGQYTLPGGENYREVLLTLPTKRELPSGYKVMQNPSTAPNAQKYIVVDKSGERYGSGNTESDALNKYFEYHTTDAYKSSHWDEPNVMAHLRLNDRVDVDGKKMTLIEEVQSDWHQAGREKGYNTGTSSRKATTAIRQDGFWEVRDQNGEFVSNIMDYTLPNANEATALEVANARIQANNATNVASSEMVPDAPMKDTWYQTALRKAVKDAIDQGSDRVGITTGARQAERYDLSKQVDGVFYTKNDDGTFNVSVAKGDKEVWADTSVKPEKLSDVIGKDLTKKIVDGSGADENGVKALRGLDLEVGGEGMKKYYDDIYPKYLEKFAKKYGSKVSDGSVPTERSRDASGIPSMYPQQEPVKYIEITPEMRKALGGKDKGVPLFGAGALPFGLLAADEEIKKDMQSLLGY